MVEDILQAEALTDDATVQVLYGCADEFDLTHRQPEGGTDGT